MITNSEAYRYLRVLGTALGYAVGLTGAIAFAALAFVPLEHGAYPTSKTTYAAVSYVIGNAAAASDLYEIAGSSLLFLSVVHATRNQKVAYLWLVAGGSQALGIGTLPLYRASIADYRLDDIVGTLTLGTGGIPIALPVAIVAAMLTIDTVQQNGWTISTCRIHRRVSTKYAEIASISAKSKRSRWMILSKATGYLVVLVGLGFALAGLVSTSTELSQKIFEGSAFVFLAVFVYNAVSTESVWLLTLLGSLSVAVGSAGLQYSTAVSVLTLSAGVLLLVSAVSVAIHRRSTD